MFGRCRKHAGRYDYHVFRKVKNGSVICLGNLRAHCHSFYKYICSNGVLNVCVFVCARYVHDSFLPFNKKQVIFCFFNTLHFIVGLNFHFLSPSLSFSSHFQCMWILSVLSLKRISQSIFPFTFFLLLKVCVGFVFFFVGSIGTTFKAYLLFSSV